jgi:ceramide glucosyltransferase
MLAPTGWNLGCASLGMAARLGLHLRRPADGLPAPGRPVYAPLRDGLLLLAWLSGFVGSTARWRQQMVPIDDRAGGPATSIELDSVKAERDENPISPGPLL